MSYTTEHDTLDLIRDYLWGAPWDADTRAELRELALGILERLDTDTDDPDTFTDGPHFIPEDFAV
jgi:hypothetical protein